jgi:hypothetical protein
VALLTWKKTRNDRAQSNGLQRVWQPVAQRGKIDWQGSTELATPAETGGRCSRDACTPQMERWRKPA